MCPHLSYYCGVNNLTYFANVRFISSQKKTTNSYTVYKVTYINVNDFLCGNNSSVTHYYEIALILFAHSFTLVSLK